MKMTARFSKEMIDALGVDWDRVRLFNEDLDTLEYLKDSTVAYRGPTDGPRISWQIELYSECALHRIVVLARGCAEAWNSFNVLAAFLCARALMETIAVLWDFSEQVIRLAGENDFAGLRTLIMHKMFGSKAFKEGGEELLVVNVLTIITKFERVIPGIRQHYDELSEFCHPNYFGVYGMFSEMDMEKLVATVSDKTFFNAGTFSIMAKSLVLLSLVTSFLGKLDDWMPKILALSLIDMTKSSA